MKTALFRLTNNEWQKHPDSQLPTAEEAQLVLCFGSRQKLADDSVYASLRQLFQHAEIALCSTAGEIFHDEVTEDSVVAAAIHFEQTQLATRSVNVTDFDNTYSAAMHLGQQLPKENLRYVLVLSDGSLVNGSELVKGLTAYLDNNVLVTGGLAGDGVAFERTLVGLNQSAAPGEVVAIGLYGGHIWVTHGSQGGWEKFGLEKTVTNAAANVLMSLENQNALDLYKKYLGEDAKGLPRTALLFPLSVIMPGSSLPLVRTILSIDEADKRMTFAGDIPVGSRVRFMKANFDQLIEAAKEAAKRTRLHDREPDFSLLISCVGRKEVLQQKTGEEVKAVHEALGKQTMLAGFYSYGELSPFNEGGNCQLHNQTMTITSFYEH